MRSAEEVHQFWFVDHTFEDWFGSDPEFDTLVDTEFRTTFDGIVQGHGWTWRTTPRGRLAEIIVLDQFSRQFHRGTHFAFAYDTIALVLAQEMVAQGLDQALSTAERTFAYLPYMHSESLIIHEAAAHLYADLGDEDALAFENGHLETLKRFGRYPKRNEALGRQSTPEELAYIAETEDRMF